MRTVATGPVVVVTGIAREVHDRGSQLHGVAPWTATPTQRRSSMERAVRTRSTTSRLRSRDRGSSGRAKRPSARRGDGDGRSSRPRLRDADGILGASSLSSTRRFSGHSSSARRRSPHPSHPRRRARERSIGGSDGSSTGQLRKCRRDARRDCRVVGRTHAAHGSWNSEASSSEATPCASAETRRSTLARTRGLNSRAPRRREPRRPDRPLPGSLAAEHVPAMIELAAAYAFGRRSRSSRAITHRRPRRLTRHSFPAGAGNAPRPPKLERRPCAERLQDDTRYRLAKSAALESAASSHERRASVRRSLSHARFAVRVACVGWGCSGVVCGGSVWVCVGGVSVGWVCWWLLCVWVVVGLRWVGLLVVMWVGWVLGVRLMRIGIRR